MSDEHPSRRSEYELRQRRRAQDEEDRAYRLDALARDALSLIEHLIPYAPKGERGRFWQESLALRRVLNVEMNRNPDDGDGIADALRD